MARYLERAQQTTRLLDANIHLSLGAPFRFEGSLSVPALEHALIFDAKCTPRSLAVSWRRGRMPGKYANRSRVKCGVS
ncbi:MAG: alpha-E domain-containing protein [Acidobacteriota bacterium]|jgi:uncharacterized alpha-E superfamily protein